MAIYADFFVRRKYLISEWTQTLKLQPSIAPVDYPVNLNANGPSAVVVQKWIYICNPAAMVKIYPQARQGNRKYLLARNVLRSLSPCSNLRDQDSVKVMGDPQCNPDGT